MGSEMCIRDSSITLPVPFDQLAGFPSLSDTLAMTSGRLPSEPAVSNDLELRLEPEVSVGLAEVLEDPDTLVVGPFKCTSHFPNPPSPSEACALEAAVANAVAGVLVDVLSAQPVVSSTPQGSLLPPLLMLCSGPGASAERIAGLAVSGLM